MRSAAQQHKKQEQREDEKETKKDLLFGIALQQLYHNIRNGAELNLDFLSLLVSAASMAAVALGTNNTVVVVASMLVSPLMGPILGITWGIVLDKRWVTGCCLTDPIENVHFLLTRPTVITAPIYRSIPSSWPDQDVFVGVRSAICSVLLLVYASSHSAFPHRAPFHNQIVQPPSHKY